MRLRILDEGFTRKQKLALGLMRRLLSYVPGPIATFSHRPAFFGDDFGACCQDALRGAQEWTLSEAELFAAFISDRNRCHF